MYYGIFNMILFTEQQEFYNEQDTDIEFHSEWNDSQYSTEDSYYSNGTDTNFDISNEHFTMTTLLVNMKKLHPLSFQHTHMHFQMYFMSSNYSYHY